MNEPIDLRAGQVWRDTFDGELMMIVEVKEWPYAWFFGTTNAKRGFAPLAPRYTHLDPRPSNRWCLLCDAVQ